MIVHEHFIFVHLTKTGGTFIRQFLLNNIIGARNCININDKLYKHGDLNDLPKKFRDKRLKFGGIRNPLDFYISLWAANTTERASRSRPRRKIWFKDKEVKNNPLRFIRFLNKEEKINVNL